MKIKEWIKNNKVATAIIVVLGLTALGFGTENNNTSKAGGTTTVQMQENTSDKEEQVDTEKAEELVEANKIKANDMTVVNSNGDTLTINDTEIVSTWSDKRAVKFDITWTNNDDKGKPYYTTFNIDGFMDGIELEGTPLSDDINFGIGQKEIKCGVTQDVEDGLELDTDSDSNVINIEVKDWLSFNNTPLATFEYNIDTNKLVRVN